MNTSRLLRVGDAVVEVDIDDPSVLRSFGFSSSPMATEGTPDFRVRIRPSEVGHELVIDEAKRCMSCGMCFECNNCVIFCPQDAVYRVTKDQATTGRSCPMRWARSAA